MPPPLSIVIPSHNRADLLHLCLQSVHRYAPSGTEILVVDDASSEAIVSATARRFDGVRVLRLERRGGFCVAANAGLRAATAAVVELLNDDTEVSPGWAEAALAHFDEATIGAVAPLVLCRPPSSRLRLRTGGEITSRIPHKLGAMLSRLLVKVSANVRASGPRKHEEAPHAFAAQVPTNPADGLDGPRKHGTQLILENQKVNSGPILSGVDPLNCKRPDEGDEPPRVDSAGDRYFIGGIAGKRGHGQLLGPEFLQGGDVFGASASSAFYRRDLVLSVGGFPESFGAYFEDVDLAFRLHRAGARIYYEPRSRVWHRVSASYGAPTAELVERQSRNEELVYWRNLPASRLLRSLPLHIAVIAGKAWRRWREGCLLPFLRGRLRALGSAATIIRHRRHYPIHLPCPTVGSWGVESRFWGKSL